MRRNRMLILLVIAATILGLAYSCYPLWKGATLEQQCESGVNHFYEQRNQQEQQACEATTETEAPYAELRTAIEEYNERIYRDKQAGLNGPEDYREPALELHEYGIPEEAFGVISIPTMGVELPLYLGATDDHLAKGAAVLGQTSVPIGGRNTNAVIAGHRGWKGFSYFRDIQRLQEGDIVTVTNLWETLTYEVVEIRIIEPNDIDAILIQPDRDLITLQTCHPYASGGRYRYLIICERIGT